MKSAFPADLLVTFSHKIIKGICNLRANNFHIPTNPNEDVLMVGPGTGIAPFRSFWQQREYLKKNMKGTINLFKRPCSRKGAQRVTICNMYGIYINCKINSLYCKFFIIIILKSDKYYI